MQRSCSLRHVLAAACASSALMSMPGCALFGMQSVQLHYAAPLEDGGSVRLVERDDLNLFWKPEDNKATLVLEVGHYVSPDCMLLAEQTGLKLGETHSFGIGRLSGRLDDSRTRFWLVDLDHRRIVAAYDLEARNAAGMNDRAPDWATLDGGTVVDNAATHAGHAGAPRT